MGAQTGREKPGFILKSEWNSSAGGQEAGGYVIALI